MEIDGPRIGESKLIEELRLGPFKILALTLFCSVAIAGILVVVFYPDDWIERVVVAIVALALDFGIGIQALAVIQAEERRPFPLPARRAIWCLVIAGYAVGVYLVLPLMTSRFVPVDRRIWFVVKLLALAPVPLIALRLLRAERNR